MTLGILVFAITTAIAINTNAMTHAISNITSRTVARFYCVFPVFLH